MCHVLVYYSVRSRPCKLVCPLDRCPSRDNDDTCFVSVRNWLNSMIRLRLQRRRKLKNFSRYVNQNHAWLACMSRWAAAAQMARPAQFFRNSKGNYRNGSIVNAITMPRCSPPGFLIQCCQSPVNGCGRSKNGWLGPDFKLITIRGKDYIGGTDLERKITESGSYLVIRRPNNVPK